MDAGPDLTPKADAEPPMDAPDRPLVTFALFAYNQEKYIREAVEGAFSQTYQPLEIILSDDCSSDRTFEIMQEMAEGYQGPHRVTLNRMSTNVGTIDHVLDVGRKSTGRLIVVAAGDDVSYPERTEKLASVWAATAADVLYSGRSILDMDGSIQRFKDIPEPMQKIQEIFEGTSCARRYDGKVRNIPGYSAAYSSEFLRSIPKCGVCALNEDALTTVLANTSFARIELVPVALVKYRLAESSISSRHDSSRIKDLSIAIKREIFFCRSSIRFYPYLFGILEKKTNNRADIETLIKRLKVMSREAELIVRSADLQFLGRVALLARCRSWQEARIVLSRLLGIHFLSLLKFLKMNYLD